MKVFDFSEEIIEKVIDELAIAKEYIKIAIFQIHRKNIFDILEAKLSSGVKVEIITLPNDSINDAVRDEVTTRLESLQEKGLNLYFCEWNVGDPERTTTAVGRWYSFHGKFIVTDRSAIALSSNFIQSTELDAILIYRNENDKIEEFNKKFEELKQLFITDHEGYKGTIRSKIINTNIANVEEVFTLPRVITNRDYENTWVQHYPSSLCPENVEIEEKLYLVPFDCRGQNIFENILNEAEEFIYLSTESFTDKELPTFLKKIKLKDIDMKILTGYKSMDFTDRLQKFMKELMAIGIELNTPSSEIHGKLWITEKSIVVGSINLNKMNLGFKKSSKYWRGNTETINICKDENIIEDARQKFLTIFNESMPILDKFAEKGKGDVGSLFNKTFGTSISDEAKAILSKLYIDGEIENYEKLIAIAKKAVEIKNERRERLISRAIIEDAIEDIDN